MKPSVKRLLDTPVVSPIDRRSFFKTLGVAATGAAALQFSSSSEARAASAAAVIDSNVKRASEPSALKITDLRIAVVEKAPMLCPIIRIDTNQGLSGYGEVRDGASETYALFLKSRIAGENPCNVDRVFRKIKQFGGPARQAGGVCGIEMALMDLAGKAWGVPCWQMLGGRFRDRVRIYADTTETDDPKEQGQRLKARMDRGITFLKQDFGINLLHEQPGMLSRPLGLTFDQSQMIMHPFTGIEITDKGVAYLDEWVGTIRGIIGTEVPLAADHFGHIGVNSCIRLARAMEKHQLAWMEDFVPWEMGHLLKEIRQNTTTPILTGEDIYLKEDFIKLIEMEALDMIHPDLASSGGLMETKKIGDFAMEHGVPMAMHFAGCPFSYMANVHTATATENFIALEHHSLDVPWWETLVTRVDGKPLFDHGFAPASDAPGLGVEPNEAAIREHLRPGGGYFEPTAQWDKERSWDRTWS